MARRLAASSASASAGEGGTGPGAGALELLAGLGADDGPAASLAVAERVADRLHAHLARGELDAVAGLLAQLDARSRLGLWNPFQRELLAVHLADVRVGLVAAVRRQLAGAPVPPADERRLLGMVEELLADGDPRVVKSAAWTLGELASPSSLGALLDALDQRGDTAGRVALTAALGHFDHPEALRHLVEQTRTADPELRYAALDALARLDPAGLEGLAGHLGRDDQSWIRHRYQLVVSRRAGP
jgi:hypothetical protein